VRLPLPHLQTVIETQQLQLFAAGVEQGRHLGRPARTRRGLELQSVDLASGAQVIQTATSGWFGAPTRGARV
jgi:hypothetical protein